MNFSKLLLSVALILGISISTHAQDEVSSKELLKMGAYGAALPLLLEEMQTDPGNVDLQWKIATCYLETTVDKAAAVTYLEYALQNGLKDDDAVLDLGEAYLHAGRYDDAIKKIENYKTMTKNDENIVIADKYISFAKNAKALTATPLNVDIIPLGDRVNSPKSDVMPIIDIGEEFIVFGTDRRYIANWGEYVHDVYMTQFKYGRWKRSRSVSSKVNSTDHEYLGGAMPDLSYILIRPDTYESSGELFSVEQVKARYGAPEKLEGYVNDPKAFEEAACFSVTGDTLYFSSDREGGLGGLDLYYSVRIGNMWGVPQNLGAGINTPYNDSYPMISYDSKTLYFASEGHNSMGGYDIFKCQFNKPTGEWKNPKNVGYPINSTYDDYSLSMTPSGRHGYISKVLNTKNEKGEGEYDICRVVFKDIDPHYLTYTGLIAVGDTGSYSKITSLTDNCEVKVVDENGKVFGEYTVHPEKSTYVVSLPPGLYNLKVNAGSHGKLDKRLLVKEEKHPVSVVSYDIFFDAPPPPPKPKPKPPSQKK